MFGDETLWNTPPTLQTEAYHGQSLQTQKKETGDQNNEKPVWEDIERKHTNIQISHLPFFSTLMDGAQFSGLGILLFPLTNLVQFFFKSPCQSSTHPSSPPLILGPNPSELDREVPLSWADDRSPNYGPLLFYFTTVQYFYFI